MGSSQPESLLDQGIVWAARLTELLSANRALLSAHAPLILGERQVFELITHYLKFVALRRTGLILILLLLFGGGGSYYAYGPAGGIGIVGIILIVLIVLLLSEHLSIR